MLHSFVLLEAVFNSRKTVLRIFNYIFPGCELASTSAEWPKECIANIRHVSGNLDDDFNYLYPFCKHSKYFYLILLDL